VTEGAVRSRLLELRQARDRAAHGRELLDHKREVILRALAREAAAHEQDRLALREALEIASSRLAEAVVEAGVGALDAAAIAQPRVAGVECRDDRVAGVATLQLIARFPPFRARYGLDGTTASIDGAGLAHAAALPLVIKVAQQALVVRRLQHALTETTRRLKAIENIVLPRLERTLRDVASAIEEDERAESLLRRRWLRRRGERVKGQG
jgi:V/A-type H+-transporting ATPase subunit D